MYDEKFEDAVSYTRRRLVEDVDGVDEADALKTARRRVSSGSGDARTREREEQLARAVRAEAIKRYNRSARETSGKARFA